MSALPKAIQAQLDQAEAIQAQLNSESAPTEGNPDPVEQAEATSLQLVEQPEQKTQVPSGVPEETWEQRFNVVQGKYNAEVPRLHQQVRDLSERLETAIAAMEVKAKEPPKEQQKLVTDADVEAYGADLVDMVRRAAREEFDALAKRFAAELDNRYGAVASKVDAAEQKLAKSASDKFWELVLAEHPDFDAVNNDPRWFAFLEQVVPGTDLTRRSVSENAVSSLKANVLIAQLAAFKGELGMTKPAPKAKPNLNSQVAPSSSRAAAPVAPTGRVWSGAEYAAAMDHRNLQRMSREDYEAGMAAAEQALAEGRVQF